MVDFHALPWVGFLLIIIGFIMTLLATLLLIFHSTKTKSETRTEAKGAGVILIGPFPIIFGTDKQSVKTLLVLTVIVIVLMIAFLLLNNTT